MRKKKVVTLDDAIKDPRVRQKFLRSALPKKIPYCSGVYYDPDRVKYVKFGVGLFKRMDVSQEQAEDIIRKGMQERALEFTAGFPTISHFYMCGEDFPLFVGDPLFSGDYNLQEFRHALVAHEGEHLKQNFGGLLYLDNDRFKKDWIEGNLDPIIISSICEADANYKGLLRIQNREFKVREDYLGNAVRAYNRAITDLCEADTTRSRQLEFVQAVLRKLPLKAKAGDPIF